MNENKQRFNIASCLPLMAERVPDQRAVVVAKTRGAKVADWTYQELETESNRYANGLVTAGVERGMRVLVMVRPGLEFAGLVFALFKIGAVPVMIDPGMGLSMMLRCIAQVAPQTLIGISSACAIRAFRPKSFRSVRHVITVGRRWFWGGPTLEALRDRAKDDFEIADTQSDDLAAILFTSGSTGTPKGVAYEHGMFGAQVTSIRSQYGYQPGDIELATFPLFALFCPALGATCVFPNMNFSQPGRVEPATLVQTINDQHVTSSFGSPALWYRVADYCLSHHIQLLSLRRIIIAGATASWKLVRDLRSIIDPSGDIHTPYGATEALPVCSINGHEIVDSCVDLVRQGGGICVGRPLEETAVKIIKITDEPILEWSDDLLVPDGEKGEVAVVGPIVTKEYVGLPQETAMAKIRDGDHIWHRMGDIGYFDEERRLWFCGRKNHRVRTPQGVMFTEPCEAIFNEHPDVFRSALVGVGRKGHQKPVIIVQPRIAQNRSGDKGRGLKDALLNLGQKHKLTQPIKDILLHSCIPVDVRHNAKINREKLARWAKRQLR